MLDEKQKAKILRLHRAEGWKVGSIASHMEIHHSTVTRALRGKAAASSGKGRPSEVDAYKAFIEESLERYPGIGATRVHQMIETRGYRGSIYPVRRLIKSLRPRVRAFQDITAFPGEMAQVDWADLGKIELAPGVFRSLQCFVMVLGYSRKIYAEVFHDQKMPSLLEGHVNAFSFFAGIPRRIIYDNMKTAVIKNLGVAVQFNDNLIQFAGHHNFELTACNPASGWEKGRVERSIRYLRDNFSPKSRSFRGLDDLNSQLKEWLVAVTDRRLWQDDRTKAISDVFKDDHDALLPLAPEFPCYGEVTARVNKKSMVQFDTNLYTVPPVWVGRTLFIRYSSKEIKVYFEQELVATHERCWLRNKRIARDQDVDAIVRSSKARGLRQDRSLIAKRIPSGTHLLRIWSERGENLSTQSRLLGLLIGNYGVDTVEAAVQLAMENSTPRADSIEHLIHCDFPPPPTAKANFLRADLAKYQTKSHDLKGYDDL